MVMTVIAVVGMSLSWISTPGWIALGGVALFGVSIAVGLMTGRLIRGRDGQVPTDAQEPGGLIATPENADQQREELDLW